MYGLARENGCGVRPTASSIQFVMRPEAKFDDGTPLTAQDVASRSTSSKPRAIRSSPNRCAISSAPKPTMTKPSPRTFAPKRARDVPLFVAGLPIFARAYYATKPFDDFSLDTRSARGTYKVGRFEPGRYIEYDRVKDWWGADLPVARGQNNFDVLRFEYYRDRDVGFEGFTAGSYLFREEFTSRTWATRYDFPALKDGRVKQDDAARRYAVRRARLVHQYAAAAICRSAAARGAQQRVRFRMDQQEYHVRRLSSAPSRCSRIPR